MSKEVELKELYPQAYKEVMSNPISLIWDNMEEDRKEEILKGITENLEANGELI